MTSVFGSKCSSGPNMILFKQIGYSVTIFFLLLTIVIHLGIKDIRKVCKSSFWSCNVKYISQIFQDIGGKMVIGITSSMLGTYVCLFINTFDEASTIGDVSKENPTCIANGKNTKNSYVTTSKYKK